MNTITQSYMSGFGNHFASESLEGTLPQGRNSPQKCAYGLYAEQLSGSAFTAPRHSNQRSWLYRIHPSVKHQGSYRQINSHLLRTAPAPFDSDLPIGALRWNPLPIPQTSQNFIEGLSTISLAGDAQGRTGSANHIYLANKNMQDEYFFNADGELLIIPELGRLKIHTELGIINLEIGEIAVIPRGVVFAVTLPDQTARGYVCENYGASFTLPGRGPIGANCLANARDFLTPHASFEDRDADMILKVKWCGRLYQCSLSHSPLDVVAWHGNYAPYKYNLRDFSPIGALLFDHPDPSIFTVLTSPSGTEGTANIDFVIFSERWMVAENTFRPPWYHRNIMSEFMGLIYGTYDAKEDGFSPGGASLHNCMLPHGPDPQAFEKASKRDLQPHKLKRTMTFMFESYLPQHLTKFAASTEALQKNYIHCWQNLTKHFDGSKTGNWQ